MGGGGWRKEVWRILVAIVGDLERYKGRRTKKPEGLEAFWMDLSNVTGEAAKQDEVYQGFKRSGGVSELAQNNNGPLPSQTQTHKPTNPSQSQTSSHPILVSFHLSVIVLIPHRSLLILVPIPLLAPNTDSNPHPTQAHAHFPLQKKQW